MFERFRALLGFEHNEEGEPVKWPNNVIAEMIACPWCLGLWTAAISYGLWELEPLITMVIAASAVVVIVEKYLRG